MSDSQAKTLAILVTCSPESVGFRHTLGLARAGIRQGLRVFVYCLDDAVSGVGLNETQKLKSAGVRLFACSHGALKRKIPMQDQAVFSGLPTLSDLIQKSDKFVCFS